MRGNFTPIYDIGIIPLSDQKDIEYEENSKYVYLYLNACISNVSLENIKECKILNIPDAIKTKNIHDFLIPCKSILNHLSGICKITVSDFITIKFQGMDIQGYDGNLILSSIFTIKNTILQYRI